MNVIEFLNTLAYYKEKGIHTEKKLKALRNAR